MSDPLMVVHRDFGPEFLHVINSAECPCCPTVIEVWEHETTEQFLARLALAERPQA